MLADHALELPRPQRRHVLLAASFVAHALVIGWLLAPRVERVEYAAEPMWLQMIQFPPLRQPCIFITVRHHSGCLVTERTICAPEPVRREPRKWPASRASVEHPLVIE